MSSEEHQPSPQWVDKFLSQFIMDWRVLAFLLVAVICASFVFFLAIRMRATYLIENQSALHDQQIIELRKELAECKAQGAKDLADMAATVYGPVTKGRRPSVVETWSLKRDKELRERIRQLELWRYRMEHSAK
jgi:hypothetical protein